MHIGYNYYRVWGSLGRYKNSISWNNKVIEVSKQLHEYYYSINLVQYCRHIGSLIFEQIRQMSIVHKTHSEKSIPKFLIKIVSTWPWYIQIWPWYIQIYSLLGKLFNWTQKTNFKIKVFVPTITNVQRWYFILVLLLWIHLLVLIFISILF